MAEKEKKGSPASVVFLIILILAALAVVLKASLPTKPSPQQTEPPPETTAPETR